MAKQSVRANGRANVLATMTGIAFAAGLVGVMASAHLAAAVPMVQAEGDDTLVFRNGNVLTGTIVSETATTVVFKSSTRGLSFETEYQKTEILEIKRGTGEKKEPSAPSAQPAISTPAIRAQDPTGGVPDLTISDPNAVRYYWITLKGNFGEEISQKPLRNAIRDAKKNKADCIIFEMNAEWYDPNSLREKTEDLDANFDGLFRAEQMIPILVNEMPVEWEKMPRMAFWVKDAMAGAAFLPLVCKEIYFHPDGRLGGFGNLGGYLKMGHERVMAKQISLRLQHAVGWANVGGYPEELIRAMAIMDYTLSYKVEGGKVVYFERMPQNPGEELLTDDGEGQNADTVRDRVTGEGNDVLTLKPRIAQTLGVSKGTVASKEELLSAMGIDRSGVEIKNASGRSPSVAIMDNWAKGLANGKRAIRKAIEDYQEIRVQNPNNYDNRTRARNARLAKLREIKQLLKEWGEGITQRWLQENGVPSEAQIAQIEESIKIDQLKDRK